MRKCAAPDIMIAAWAAALLALVALFGACAGAQEVTPPVVTPTPIVSANPAPVASTPAIAATATPTQVATPGPGGAGGDMPSIAISPATPLASPAPIPAEWATYEDKRAGYSLRYPGTWFDNGGGQIISWDYASSKRFFYPPDGTIVETRTWSLQEATSSSPRPPEAADFSMGEFSGWHAAYTYAASDDGRARLHTIAIEQRGLRYYIIGFFGSNQDETVFLQILSSFQFTTPAP